MNKKIAISQSNYIPWKGYFDMINMVDVFVIYDEVQYTKNDWRNRNIVKTKKGTEWITIPVKHKSLDQRIDEIEVFLPKWNVKHWKTIQAIYGRAPFFKNYKERFEKLYLEIDTLMLSEINKKFILEICDILNIKTQIIDSKELFLVGDANERLIDACNKLEAKVYVSGPAAKSYIKNELFHENSIEIEWINYSGYKEYNQMSIPFEHGVSVLDLIFNEGEKANLFLKSFNS
ncbi:WbqC-like protein [Aquimarina sp. MAR_2010_214]|uniref:WbqC family protein n=1 Tax=Aquimarina sp. MAR_2010_214 TaxID=1250026 RepID=UPI000CC8ECF6|nr:WbqC family protein [Aquimarina sp. MAR_2010_214]PKV49786.1 WbqC-like protein [Aquimarina sp. MAR_2010_214]